LSIDWIRLFRIFFEGAKLAKNRDFPDFVECIDTIAFAIHKVGSQWLEISLSSQKWG
jgi:hypothetical protein